MNSLDEDQFCIAFEYVWGKFCSPYLANKTALTFAERQDMHSEVRATVFEEYSVKKSFNHTGVEELSDGCVLPRKFKEWVWGITRNKTYNFVRKRQRRKTDSNSGLSLLLKECNFRSPADTLERKELCDLVRRAIDELSDEIKQIVKFKYYHELKYHEIAQMVYEGKDHEGNKAKVKRKLEAGRNQLRLALEALNNTNAKRYIDVK